MLAIWRTTLVSALNVVSTGGYYGAYVVVVARRLGGAVTPFNRSRAYIEKILSGFNDIFEQAVFLTDLFEFFAMEPTISSAPGAMAAPREIRQGFEFRHVGFAYAGSDRVVIQSINFTLHPYETLALIGSNRTGKTTLVKASGAALRPDGRADSAGRNRPARVRRGGSAARNRRNLPRLHAL